MLKVLVIDDEQGILDIVEDELTERGFEVYTAQRGKDGLRKAQHYDFDFVVCDLHMPDMSGEAIIKQLKLPHLIFTGCVTAEMLGEITCPIVFKPAMGDEIAATINKTVRLKHTTPSS